MLKRLLSLHHPFIRHKKLKEMRQRRVNKPKPPPAPVEPATNDAETVEAPPPVAATGKRPAGKRVLYFSAYC